MYLGGVPWIAFFQFALCAEVFTGTCKTAFIRTFWAWIVTPAWLSNASFYHDNRSAKVLEWNRRITCFALIIFTIRLETCWENNILQMLLTHHFNQFCLFQNIWYTISYKKGLTLSLKLLDVCYFFYALTDL